MQNAENLIEIESENDLVSAETVLSRKTLLLRVINELQKCFEIVRVSIKSNHSTSVSEKVFSIGSSGLEYTHLNSNQVLISLDENEMLQNEYDFSQSKIYISLYPEFNTAEVRVLFDK